jgi:hypothetical protein
MPDRSDAELLSQLRGLLDSGHAALDLDARRLDKPDSPVSVQAESTRWLYALIVAVAAASWLAAWPGGVLAAAAAIAAWYGFVRPDVARRIRARVETRAVYDVVLWRQLWRHGGVAIAEDGRTACRAPDGNWMAFVRARCPRRGSGDGR